jgi:hypothetical protein
MNKPKSRFLAALLGEHGAQALNKAADRSDAVAGFILPRTAMAWVEMVGRVGSYSGTIPGNANTFLSFAKSEDGNYRGQVDWAGTSYTFEDASADQLVAAVVVALECDCEAPTDDRQTPQMLQGLGKSIDLLVKARVYSEVKLAKTQDLSGEKPGEAQSQEGAVGPGKADPPEGPATGLQDRKANLPRGDIGIKVQTPQQRPAEPRTTTNIVPETPTVAGTSQRPRAVAKIEPSPSSAAPVRQIPRLSKVRRLRLSEKQLRASCEACRQPLVAGGNFVGCLCFRDLRGATKLLKGGILELDSAHWDDEAILTLIDSLGERE